MKSVVLFLASATAAFGASIPSDPVCIVGAGPAGLTTANKLQAKGYSTVVFEKNEAVGGKCQSYYNEQGLFHPLGALLFSNETYTETVKIINTAQVQATPFDYTFKNWLFDYESGHIEQQKEPMSVTAARPPFKENIDRYIKIWHEQFEPIVSLGYKKGVPKEMTVPTIQWLLKNKLPFMLVLFIQGMVPYGYGDILETPAVYMLQYFTPDIVEFFAGKKTGYIIDFQKVFQQYAEQHVKGPLHLCTTINKIDRTGPTPVITYTLPGQTTPTTQTCSKLVLAFPPVMHALQAANLAISPEEQEAFSPVGVTKYWSGAVNVNTPNGDNFAGFLRPTFINTINEWLNKLPVPLPSLPGAFIPFMPKANGQPTAFIRVHNASQIATTWSWGKYKSNQTLNEGYTLLKSTISKINKDPRDTSTPPKGITDTDIKAFKEWDYFPHYDTKELSEGYYEKFNALQGKLNTFYASGLNGFETVEFAIRAGNDIVESHF
ncbi:uncharacterized protein SPPG_01711 [Spizellomyces punctatus DAOM BR117]|uniref:Amine oxidase domain-containing protein n=1 Tax=Spizellomyces punctatus (strain DAOM BR117) TaxID=645134 RepID=A0A0L0HNH1_SPIPD|nr:uncharacterized protein SPPG_01711 [Spizellomyces punctatus DAOM BR117]KND02622.1 hypothetical protein SPPG_01711 [Spizellomyces punctatus DAOM BR117]|eukprot:XP_016610661.1 hypothetical protein SPPG_01711 [Spizellomyces punctatus DAOM BR117]